MDENQQTKDATAPRASGDAPQSVSAPTISLPKGGGAMRGIGEKFAANPVTGTGSMTVPIATSPGRTGFGPQLALSYDSGAGNGPFGFGWSLPLPAITRKTDKGLPQYQDGDESDVFLLSGAEDLVPVLIATRAGRWEREPIPPRTVNGNTYHIQRYRPRIEGLLARIERWTNHSNPADSFWRSISKDNITTWYGKTAESRIVDPADTSRIFSWLICESYDDKGNAITYEYKPEDSAGIDLSQAHEQHRTERSRSAQRYLKHIRYGNRLPFLPRYAPDQPPTPLPTEWLFEVVFDYGEHHLDAPRPTDRGVWPVRNDPFSSYRAGFEVRTYRLCQRVLMFHHFPDEPEVGADCLVRSTDFAYSYERDRTNARNPIFSLLCSVTQMGYKRQPAGGYLRKSLPPVELTYSEARLRDEIHEVDPGSVDNLPEGLSGSRYEWVDLDGEGLSGVLTEQADGWLYKRNLSPITHVGADGAARVEPCFAPVERLTTKPAVSLASGQVQLLDLAGNGQLDVVSFRGPTPGFYERTRDEGWEPFLPFSSLPVVEWNDPNLRFVDLTGDGHADILITEDAVFTWYPSLAEAGFGPAERVSQALTEEHGPRLVLTDSAQSIYLADLSGDGLTDLVRIRNGDVCYWPNLGYGRFGAKVTMDDAPWFETPDLFDQRRIRLADIDGSGVTDILYLGRDGVHIFFNQSGNSWSRGTVLAHFPPIDNIASVNVLDLLGIGTACLVWSSPLPGEARRPMRYVDLMSGQKPHLLIKTRNNLGAETVVQYAPSTKFYLADKLAGTPWVTTLPFPVQCVAKVTVTDQWRQTMFSTSYSYHHGYFDGIEREFRGFGRVEQVDVESYGEFTQGNATSPYITDDKTLYQPPVKTVTWFHTGAAIDRERILSQFVHEYFPLWFEALRPTERNVLGAFQEHALPEPDLGESHLTTDEWREALRACKGMTLRQEVYELDVDALEDGEHRRVRLFSAATHNCHIQRLQEQATNRHAVFLVTESEAITYHYELDLRQTSLQPDPRIAHTLNLKVDGYGHVLQSAAVTYPRIEQFADASLSPQALRRTREVQAERHLAYTETRYTNDVADPDNYRPRVPCEVLSYELTGINPERLPYFTFEELRRYRLSEVHQATGTPVAPIPYHQLTRGTSPRKRCVEHVRMLFFDQNLRDPLPFGTLNAPGLPYETYTLALTEDLLHRIFADKLTPAVRRTLHDATISGYLSGLDLAHRFPGLDTTDQSWRRSGIAGFAPDAA
ncbi:MAG: SpvB/TcaC N-terminal domain-containing protein, partial [Bryobacteraceae bacterium]